LVVSTEQRNVGRRGRRSWTERRRAAWAPRGPGDPPWRACGLAREERSMEAELGVQSVDRQGREWRRLFRARTNWIGLANGRWVLIPCV
jgi:hypothetical protein